MTVAWSPSIYEAERDDVESAIESAVRAFAVHVRCRRTSVPRIAKDHRRITVRREEFARTICQEAGKPIRTARTEVERAISTFQIPPKRTRASTANTFRSTPWVDRRTLGPGAPFSARPGLCHSTVPLSAEPGGPQAWLRPSPQDVR